jgi:PAS domain S-box-containing protein
MSVSPVEAAAIVDSADVRAPSSIERALFLAEAGRALFSSLDYETTLTKLARLAVPRIADWCAVDVLEDGAIRRVAVAHRQSGLEELALELARRYPATLQASAGVGRVLRTGRAVLYEVIDEQILRELAHDEEHLRILREQGLRSAMIVPLVAHGQVLGDLTFVTAESGRSLGEDDLAIAEELARYSALALDNARLYRLSEENRAVLDAFIEAAPVAVGFLDPQLRYLRMNPTLAAINGVRADEVVGRTLREIIPAYADTLEPLYRRVLDTGEPIRGFEISGVRPSHPGKIAHFLVNYFPIRVAGGDPLGVGLIGLDITERKEAELREQIFSEVLEDSRQEIYLFDADTLCFVRVNRGARLNLGYSMEELSRMTPLDISPEFTPKGLNRLLEPLRTGHEEVLHFETIQRRKDGTQYPVDVHLQLSHSAEGLIFVALVLDITERRGAEEALRQAESQFRTLANSIPQLAWMADAEGSIFWYNRRWYEYTGTTLDEIKDWGWQAVHHPDEVERVVSGYRQAVKDAEPWEDTFPLRSRSGEYRWFLSRALPVRDQTGQVVRWFGTNTDVTEQRLAAQERQRLLEVAELARAEAEAANRAKTEFLSAMSHELRTPLNAIAGYVDLLEAGIRGPLSQPQLTDLGRIKRSQEILLSLINDLLYFAKLDAGRLEFRREPVPVGIVTEDLEAVLDPQLRAKRLRYACAMTDAAELICGDAERIRQILINLLANATKFTDPGGDVEVFTAAEEDSVVIRVRDTGWGIEADRLDHIFDPFVQLNRPRTAGSPQGIGLGLAISRELAREMGGDLTVESAPGVGSTFFLRLPRWPGTDFE